jgi:hypothetical protein
MELRGTNRQEGSGKHARRNNENKSGAVCLLTRVAVQEGSEKELNCRSLNIVSANLEHETSCNIDKHWDHGNSK